MTSLDIIDWGVVQPENIYEFGARYFQELKEQHAHAPGPAAHSAVELVQDMKAAELQAQLLRESRHTRGLLGFGSRFTTADQQFLSRPCFPLSVCFGVVQPPEQQVQCRQQVQRN